MNKTALKNFAINARKELIEKVNAKAFSLGVSEESIKKAQFETSDAIYIDGKQLSATEKKQRENLISRIKEIGYKQVIEEVAYTWFNRFTALRFMEVNNYLPTKVRLLSSTNPDSSEPDIIKEALTVDLDVDKELVYEMKLNNKTEELFKYLVIKQCNSLNKILPFMFETIDDYKEILFPNGLLAKDSFLCEMTDLKVISESDWGQVEIIGWLYQYYITDEKDRVIKAKKKYLTEEIPFATQLFTPAWIVRYMVQNSLGRYWIEAHPEDRDLVDKWEFFLENLNHEPDFEDKLDPYVNKELKVENIRCYDPAMGSGHILVYMFDVMYEIYSKCGYMEREIPKLIIENNLYGLDIDDRAYQLACFSIVMKAMQYNNRFFRSIEKDGLTLNLVSIKETNHLNEDDIAYLVGEGNIADTYKVKGFVEMFKDAKTYGSLIRVENYDKTFLTQRLDQIQMDPITDLFELELRKKIVGILPILLKQAEIMSLEYDILVTNPPYIGNKYLNSKLSNYMELNYSDVKSDLFSAFIEYSFSRVKDNGQLGFMTPFVWMFIGSYEKLRNKIITDKNISSLVQLEYSAFEEATVPICTFTLRNHFLDSPGSYIRLSDFKGAENQPTKVIEAKGGNTDYYYSSQAINYKKIPGSPIAYWISGSMVNSYTNGTPLGEFGSPKTGMTTADNNRFLRLWFEVEFLNVKLDCKDRQEAQMSGAKWFPYSKGGGYRKWKGFDEYLINWENDGFEIKNNIDSSGKKIASVRSEEKYFKPCITWSAVTSYKFSSRLVEHGKLFDSGGSSIFVERDTFFLQGVLNSKIADTHLSLCNPTLNFQPRDIASIPVIYPKDETTLKNIEFIVKENCDISKLDWDAYETSWDFKLHPLLQFKSDMTEIRDVYGKWNEFTEMQFIKMKNNEEELNRVLINLYELQEEMTPEVDENDITISKADRERDIKSFVSYAIGCMFGRYSLDTEGLVYAGGKFNREEYKVYTVDKDNILPILSDNFFDEDIVSKFIEFVKITFGEDGLARNIEYIADTLNKKDGETAKEVIRRYLLNDFFKDHAQIYKKRPIYWLFTSGKQKAFNCLIYMHRYDKSTLSRIRTDYLHELQIRMDAEKKSFLDIINGDSTTKEISNAKKELKTLDLKIEELRAYDEKLHHMADMQIEIDLDDGVAVNYAKFEGLLAPIK